MSEVQLYILDHERIVKDMSSTSETRKKLIKEFSNLSFNMSLESDQNFNLFYSDFFLKIPELYLMNNFIDIFSDCLELEQDLLQPILDSLSLMNKTSRKRLYSEVGKCKNNTEENENHKGKSKKETSYNDNTIDSFFSKEIGFRNVKEKIEAGTVINTNNMNKLKIQSDYDKTKAESEASEHTILQTNCTSQENTCALKLLNKTSSPVSGNLKSENNDVDVNKLTHQDSQNFSRNPDTHPNTQNTLNSDILYKHSQVSVSIPSFVNNLRPDCIQTGSNMTKKDYTTLLNENLSYFKSIKDKGFKNISQTNNSIDMLNIKLNNITHQESNTNMMSQQSCKSANSNRSNSVLSSNRGINSRLAYSTMGFVTNIRKQKSVRKKANLKIVDKLIDQFTKEENEQQKKFPENITNFNCNPLKRMINKDFYAKNKELKSPSPMSIHIPKFSKKKVEETKNEDQIKSTSKVENNFKSYSNSNSEDLNQTFNLLKNKPFNPLGHSYQCREDTITNDRSKNPHAIILQKTPMNNKSKSVRKMSKNSLASSDDDEILVKSTPTKESENLKFGRKAPNTRTNLMNLFQQMNCPK